MVLFVQLQSGGGSPFDLDAWRYMTYVSGQNINTPATLWPTPRKIALNELVVGLKAANIWEKLHGLWLLAAPDAAYPLVNLKVRQAEIDTNTTATGIVQISSGTGVSFDDDRGYSFGSAVAPIDVTTAFPFTAYAPNALTSMSFGAWSLTDTTSDTPDIGTVEVNSSGDPVHGRNLKIKNASGNALYRINNVTYQSVSVSSSKGFFIASRIDDDISLSRNGSIISTATEASYVEPSAPSGGTGVAYGDDYFGGVWNPFTFGYSFSPREYAAVFIGDGLTSAEQTDFSDILSAYFLTFLTSTDLGV